MKNIIHNKILKKKRNYLIKSTKSLLIIVYIIYILINIKDRKKFKKIGIIGLPHSQNIGNNLLNMLYISNYMNLV